MKRTLKVQEMEELMAGDVKTFCAGWAAGIGVGLSLGWTLGPVGIGFVLTGAAICLAADSSYK